MKLIDLSPSRLIALSFAGYLIASGGFALMSSRTLAHLAHRVGFLTYILLCFALIGLGVVFAYKAATALGDGVRLERWTSDELRTPRRIIEHPVCRVIDWLAIALAVGVLVIAARSRHQGLDFLYMPILYFTFWRSCIRQSLKEPRISEFPQSPIPTARLQSQHWGQ